MFFDAKSYDIESFDLANNGRFALHYVAASLGPDTVYAAAGCRAVCLFVNEAATRRSSRPWPRWAWS